jgi:radical SAM protein with 4Fe4S-binding SPASM domain
MSLSDASPHGQEDLKRKLAWRGEGPSRGRVFKVYIDLNNRCNLKCRMCGFSDPRVASVPKYDMPRSLFDSIAAQVFPLTSLLVLSMMSEPFMTRDFPDRLARVREFAVPYSEIITNGTLLNERTIGKILDARITRVTFSIDGGTKQIYESIRPGAVFQVVLYNFSLFQSMRKNRGAALPQLRINHVLSEPNIDHFDEFLRLVEKVQPEMVGVRTVSRMGRAAIQPSRDPAFWEKVCTARDKLAEFCRRTGIEDGGFLRDRPSAIDLFDDSGEKIACRAPWENIAIHANGDVCPCIAWTRAPLGNFARQSFEEIWEGSEARALRREFEEANPGLDCLNCAMTRDVPPGQDDDFFYRKVAKRLPGFDEPSASPDRAGQSAPACAHQSSEPRAMPVEGEKARDPSRRAMEPKGGGITGNRR